MLDNTSDYKSVICYLVLFFVIYSIYKKQYLALTFSWSFTSYSLGGGEVFGLSFAKIYIPLYYILTLHFLLRSNKPQSINKKFDLFIIVLVTIVFKILLDTFYYGFDQFRTETLLVAFHVIFLSMYIFHKSFEFNGFEKTIKEFLWSGLFIHGIVCIILFYPIFQNQFIPAVGLRHRITIFNQDTINSAKPFYFFIVFLLAAFQIGLIDKRYLKISASVIAIICFFIILLNGTRQFIIGLLLLAIFPNIKLNLKTIVFTGLTLIMIPILASIIENNFSDLVVAERFSSDEFDRENEMGRTAIWKMGFSRMLNENPILGLGFRNYGNIVDVSSPDNPNVVIKKDNAHGFFQEVFIEHGIILGLLLFMSFLFSLFKLRRRLISNISLSKSIFIILIGFIIPNIFTGYITTSMGFYFLGLFIYNLPKLSLQNGQKNC